MHIDLLKEIVLEIAVRSVGARVDKILRHGVEGVMLAFHGKQGRTLLLLSPEPRLPRIHLVSQKPPAGEGLFGFQLVLKKQLAGAQLESIAVVNDDRIVELVFKRNAGSIRLLFEVFGNKPNLILADREHVIIAVLRPRPLDAGEKRPMLPGLRYEFPVRQTAPVAPEKIPGILPAAGGAVGCSANRSVERHYEAVFEQHRASSLSRELTTALKKQLAKTERKIEAIAADLDSAKRADEYRQKGDLLLANLHAAGKGAAAVELAGQDGETVMIPLDPSRTPAENADLYYRKYKKAKAGISVTKERFDEAAEGKDLLLLALGEVEKAPDAGVLGALRERLEKLGVIRSESRDTEKSALPAVSPYRTVEWQGWQILVGKSAAGNDYITMRLAGPHDIWMHAEGMPGSHVLVRNPRKQELPPEILLKAASLAAYFSKGKAAAKVAVAYTQAKYVRKPTGAKPGSVILTERRTIMVQPMPV